MSIPNVCVMMSTYNGKKYLGRQIESILSQKSVNVQLLIRDDGSSDNTIMEIPNDKRIELMKGSNVGVGNSFWNLLNNDSSFEYYAWADQDDVWDLDKLKIAIEHIKNNSNPICLYYSANRRVDKDLNTLSVNRVDYPSLSFGHALIESEAQGATMVFTKKLKDIGTMYHPDFKGINILHDAWLHKLCLAVGGSVIYDSEPHISYRIHGENVIARMPETISQKRSIKDRINSFLYDPFVGYNSRVAEELLDHYSDLIPKQNKVKLIWLVRHKTNIFYRVRILFCKEIRTGKRKTDTRFIKKVLRGKA